MPTGQACPYFSRPVSPLGPTINSSVGKGQVVQSTIIVIEDEQDTLNLVAYYLENAGNIVRKAVDGVQGLLLCREQHPDLVVLDLMLPGMDGKEVCRAIRQDKSTRGIPVLILSAKVDEIDRIVGFEIGADDYMTKPFSPRELVLRVEAILNRTRQETPSVNLCQSGALLIDPDRHKVEVDGNEIELTATEFRLLHYLATRSGRVQSREILLDKIWGYTYEGYSRTVDTHIRRLRKKLGPFMDRIETVRGVGYRFRDEI